MKTVTHAVTAALLATTAAIANASEVEEINNLLDAVEMKVNAVTAQEGMTTQAIADVMSGRTSISCRLLLGWADLNGGQPQRWTTVTFRNGEIAPPLQLGGKVDENDRLFLRYECF